MGSDLVRSGRIWPVMIVGLLGLNISIATLTLVLATSDDSFAVEPDYYQRAVKWDEHARTRAEQAKLGWRLSVEAGPLDVRGDRLFTAVLADRDGRAVEGATITGWCFHDAAPAARVELTLTPSGRPGEYAATGPMARAGNWTIDLRAVRGDDAFDCRQSMVVGGLSR